MSTILTPENLAKIKRQPDDATLGDWVVSMRTLKRPTEDAEKLLHERLDKVPFIAAGCGTTITRKIQGGSYDVKDPEKFLTELKDMLPTTKSQAACLKPSMTRIKDEIAAVMNCPKTGQSPVTAEGVFDARLRPLVEQGERKILIFT